MQCATHDIYIYACIFVHIYIHMFTRIHTHTHMNAQIDTQEPYLGAPARSPPVMSMSLRKLAMAATVCLFSSCSSASPSLVWLYSSRASASCVLCVAVCCSVLQCVAASLQCAAVWLELARLGVLRVVCCSVLQCVAVLLQCVAVLYSSHVSALFVAVYCSAVAVRCGRARTPWRPVCCVLHCVAAYLRSALQCVPERCSLDKCVAVYCSVAEFSHPIVVCVARSTSLLKGCCSVLQCVAVCCSVLQCVAVCCSVL